MRCNLRYVSPYVVSFLVFPRVSPGYFLCSWPSLFSPFAIWSIERNESIIPDHLQFRGKISALQCYHFHSKVNLCKVRSTLGKRWGSGQSFAIMKLLQITAQCAQASGKRGCCRQKKEEICWSKNAKVTLSSLTFI